MANHINRTTKSETALILMGDAVVDLLVIMVAMTLIASFIPNILALPILVITLTSMAFFKRHYIRTKGRHPCLTMMNKKLPSNHESTSYFFWPSILSVGVLLIFSILSTNSAHSNSGSSNDLYDAIENLMFSVSIDKIFSLRLAIPVLTYFSILKIKIATEII